MSGSGSAGWTVRVKLCDSHAPGASEAPKAAPTFAILLSVTLSLTRFGLSAEPVLQTSIVYLTLSPTFDSVSPVLVIVSDGWNRLVEWLSLSEMSFGNPAGW